MDALSEKQERLFVELRRLGSCAVAFSGGVDSAVLAYAAQQVLGDRALAVTAVSASLAQGEREAAQQLARQIGIRHVEMMTNELDRPSYVANHFDRCFHCKTELYGQMQAQLEAWGVHHVANGANVDDFGDHRPGMRAAKDFQVRTPLVDAMLAKADVRELARRWELSVAEKPATPCLSSRIAYGVSVTQERLQQVDQAEAWLRRQGLFDTRVRYHGEGLARLEVHSADLSRLTAEPLRSEVVTQLQQLGFRFVTLDLQGRRAGSLNVLIPLEELEQVAADVSDDDLLPRVADLK